MLTTLTKKRLLKLALFLERLNPKNFNLDHFTGVQETNETCNISDLKKVRQKPEHKCGTTACAMGWTPAIFPHLVKWDKDGNIVQRGLNKEHIRNFSIAELLFDFPCSENYYTITREFSYLFMPERYHRTQRGPKHVAKRIRKYIEDDGALPETLPYYPQ